MDDQSKYKSPDWIDAYLLDELSETQKLEFEEALRNDSELKREVDHYKAVKEGVEALGREDLKERLKALEEKAAKEAKSSKRTMAWYSSRVAAVIILLILPLYFILTNLSEVDSQEVFAGHFEPYPVLANGVVRGDAPDDPLSEGLRAYQNANYALAIAELKEIANRENESKNGSFYLALSYLASDDASLAIPILRDLVEDESFKLGEQANWYLGLAFLKNSEPDKARKVLRSLYKTSKDSTLRQKARSVLNEL